MLTHYHLHAGGDEHVFPQVLRRRYVVGYDPPSSSPAHIPFFCPPLHRATTVRIPEEP